jgi:hypothetical protein
MLSAVSVAPIADEKRRTQPQSEECCAPLSDIALPELQRPQRDTHIHTFPSNIQRYRTKCNYLILLYP